jgi:Clp amino terminal domain, pathogenicity island component
VTPVRVTGCAQQAVEEARGEAGRLGHDRVGTEHLLLALLRDQGCLATAALSERGVAAETALRRLKEAAGPGWAGRRGGEEDRLAGLHLPMTKPVAHVFGLATREAKELEHDRVGTEHLLLGLAREGDGVAARVLEDLGAGLLELREAVIALYSSGTEPEPLPADRGPTVWMPPAGARLRRLLPLESECRLPSGDRLVLLSLEIWSDWFDLRYAVAYATTEPGGDRPRPRVVGRCEVSDRAGTEYRNCFTSSPAYGMVRTHQQTFVPAPPPGTEVLELRFLPPSAGSDEVRPLVVSTVVL